MTSRFRLGAWAAAVLLVLPAQASAATAAFDADELDLIGHLDRVRAYSVGVDTWEVWVCDTTNGGLVLDVGAVTSLLNRELDPYFSWLSEGRYRLSFAVGGTVAVGQSGWPADPFDDQSECRGAVAAASPGGAARGALIVVDVPYAGGFATPGVWCEGQAYCPGTYPENGRWAVVGGATITSVAGNAPALRTVAHEIGHAVHFPHSFSGEFDSFGGQVVYEYDNAMDVMSGGDGDTLDVGTLGVNRYAAGWLDGARVRFHRGGTLTYRLSPPGTGGASELLVLPTDGAPGTYVVLGARVRGGYDGGLPFEGIEVYRIDHRGDACGGSASQVCWGVERRTAQVPVPSEPWGGSHVHGVGAVFTVDGVTVEVLGFDGGAFTLEVTGASVSERFVDDDGNFHESAIEAIADLGVSTGCDPTLSRYCPTRGVSRAEMAAFLLRAIGDSTVPAGGGTFRDVPAGQWYTPYVERLAELGISVGYEDGTFRPHAIVTRAEMAVFLSRTFPSLSEVAAGGIFADVPATAWYAGAAEGLYGAGVTTGCSSSPLAYCPSAPVARDAMASFLARALGLLG